MTHTFVVRVTISVDEMQIGADMIHKTGATLTEISTQVKDSISEIGGQINEFKIS